MATCDVNLIQNALGIQQTGPRTVIVPADPIEWDDATSYEYLTLVTSTDFGQAYVSKRDVPAGTPLTNTNYWLPAAQFNAQLAAIQKRLSKIESELEEADESPLTGMFMCNCDRDTSTFEFLWCDGGNATLVGYTPAPAGSDFTSMFKRGDYYYIFTNANYIYTKDFKSFVTVDFDPFPGHQVFGVTDVPDENYIIFSSWYKDGTITTWAGHDTYYVRPYVMSFTQNDDGTLSFGQRNILTISDFSEGSYIDPTCIRLSTGSYVIAFKNDVSDEMEVYTAANSAFITAGLSAKVTYNVPIKGWEGAKLYEVGTSGRVNAVVSMYLYSAYVNTLFTPSGGSSSSKNTPAIFTDILNNGKDVYPIAVKNQTRHVSIIKPDSVISSAFTLVTMNEKTVFNNFLYNPYNGESTYNGPFLSGLTVNLLQAANVTMTFTSESPIQEKDQNVCFRVISGRENNPNIKVNGPGINSPVANANLVNNTGSYVPRTIVDGSSGKLHKNVVSGGFYIDF